MHFNMHCNIHPIMTHIDVHCGVMLAIDFSYFRKMRMPPLLALSLLEDVICVQLKNEMYGNFISSFLYGRIIPKCIPFILVANLQCQIRLYDIFVGNEWKYDEILTTRCTRTSSSSDPVWECISPVRVKLYCQRNQFNIYAYIWCS